MCSCAPLRSFAIPFRTFAAVDMQHTTTGIAVVRQTPKRWLGVSTKLLLFILFKFYYEPSSTVARKSIRTLPIENFYVHIVRVT